jgi:SAM-dependent methyltransferase
MDADRDHLARIRRERAFFARHARAGDELSWAETQPLAPHRRAMRARRLVDAAGLDGGDGLRVLDIGCGTASYTRPISERTRAIVFGTDVTPETLSEASRVVPANVRLTAADAMRLPFPTGCFDAVVGNAILHHLPLESAVPELLRVLVPGGRFCFAEPNLLNPLLFVLLNVPGLRERAGATPDETAFVRGPLRRTLQTLGLVDIHVEPFDFLYPAAPESWFDAVEKVAGWLEATPGIREIAGSLLITAKKPAA